MCPSTHPPKAGETEEEERVALSSGGFFLLGCSPNPCISDQGTTYTPDQHGSDDTRPSRCTRMGDYLGPV